MRLQRKSDLNDTKAEQNHTDCSNESEDEVRQVIYHGNRVVSGKSGNAHTEYKGYCCNNGAVSMKAFLNLSGHRQSLSSFLFIVLIEISHRKFLR